MKGSKLPFEQNRLWNIDISHFDSKKNIRLVVVRSFSLETIEDIADLSFLLDHFMLSQMLDVYKRKHNQKGNIYIISSLVYFDDIELNDMPRLLEQPNLSIAKITKRIQ